ncbi:MAG: hypothetical protein GKS03_16505 [Alphaproteobacteria bacterium]|nr:hypothetical protein [Alphaproteobacteria bacterium]
MSRLAAVLVVLVCGQAALSWSIREMRPTLGIMPDLPHVQAVDVLAFGDSQFLFRYLALTIQNAGDNGGRVTPLKNYDYEKVVAWLRLLDRLDLNSHWVIAMANGYFGQTQRIEDVAPIVRYMQSHVAQQPERKWPWLVNAVHLARHRLKSDWVALDPARQVASYDYRIMNSASLQMAALILDDLGQPHAALAEMTKLQADRGHEFSREDNAWMSSFIAVMEDRVAFAVKTP